MYGLGFSGTASLPAGPYQSSSCIIYTLNSYSPPVRSCRVTCFCCLGFRLQESKALLYILDLGYRVKVLELELTMG